MKNSILIVDDDKYLVEKLEKTVQWEKVGISTVLTAYNIRQARKLLEEVRVEMLLCDIDMPQGSGLELVEWIRSENLDIACMFLSSYANFAYAQKALRLSTREYLLKPISNQDLEEVLLSVSQECAKKRESFSREEKEKKQHLWENFFKEETEGEQFSANVIQQGQYKTTDRVIFGALKIFIHSYEEDYRKNLSLFHFIIQNVSAEFFAEAALELEEIVRMKDYEWMFVFRNRGEDAAEFERLRQFKTCLDKVMPQKKCLYLTQPCLVGEAGRAWESISQMQQHLLPGKDGVLIEEKDIIFEQQCYEMPPWEIWQASLDASAEVHTVCLDICGFLESAFGKQTLTVENLTRFLRELEEFLYSYLARKQMTFAKLFDNQEFAHKKRASYISLDSAQEFVCWIFATLEGNLQYAQNREDVVERVKEYIETYLDRDLSRSLLAKEVYLSEDYLSKLFKNAIGMSLPNYIAARRIERAKKYLTHSNLAVSKIAMKVGYSNFSYFSKTFRDMTGMTPNEYRVQRMKE